MEGRANGWRYPSQIPRCGAGQRRFDGTSFKPQNLLENTATPANRVHAVLARSYFIQRIFNLFYYILLRRTIAYFSFARNMFGFQQWDIFWNWRNGVGAWYANIICP